MQRDSLFPDSLRHTIHIGESNFAVPWSKSFGHELLEGDTSEESNLGYSISHGLSKQILRVSYIPINEVADMSAETFPVDIPVFFRKKVDEQKIKKSATASNEVPVPKIDENAELFGYMLDGACTIVAGEPLACVCGKSFKVCPHEVRKKKHTLPSRHYKVLS